MFRLVTEFPPCPAHMLAYPVKIFPVRLNVGLSGRTTGIGHLGVHVAWMKNTICGGREVLLQKNNRDSLLGLDGRLKSTNRWGNSGIS
jgi:hypothetical protein